jgi:site-specific DNA-methyltransferase (adenine-specific)
MDKEWTENDVYCVDALDGLAELEDKCAQIIIADPPYNIGKDFGNNCTKKKLEEYLEWCDKWIIDCVRILKDDGTMFIYGFSEIIAHIATRVPCNYRWLVWHYTNKNMPTLNFWQRSHESVLCCWKKSRVFNRDDIREPYTENYLKNSVGKERTATRGRFNKGTKSTTYTAHANGALPRDVIKIPALAGGAGKKERVDHPTQKPLELCRKLIKSAKQDDGLLVVPFVGSGSECVAAQELGVPFIGFEINPEYVELSKSRLDD